MANTGKEIVLTLDEMILPYPPPNPTGNTKPNVIGDPDYIAPYINLTNCPIATDDTCPLFLATGGNDIIEYEFSIFNSVLANPAIAAIKIQVLDGTGPTVQLETTYTFPMSPSETFKSATFTTVPPGSHQIDAQYLDGDDNVVAVCTNLATVTTT